MNELPHALGSRFSVADALQEGVTPDRLRGHDLERPFHRMRSVAASTFDGSPEARHLERALAYSTIMRPGEFFSHATAAIIHGLPLPAHLAFAVSIDVAVLAPERAARARGVRGHQAIPALTCVAADTRHGLMVTSPATTWAMLARMLPDLFDVVAIGDAIVREWRVDAPLGTKPELESAVSAGRRVGIERLRLALPLIRPRSASRRESHLRLALLEAGLPEAECNYDIFVGGRRVACVDLAYPRAMVAIEYEGEHHLLDPVQWQRDIQRYDMLRDAGWIVIRVTKLDLTERRRALVQRVRATLAGRSADANWG